MNTSTSAQRPDRSASPGRIPALLVSALGDGLLLFGLIQTLGAALDFAVRRHVTGTLGAPVAAYVIGLCLVWIGRRIGGAIPRRGRLARAVVALGLWCLVLPTALAPLLVRSDRARVDGLDVFVMPPSSTMRDCWAARGCNEYAIGAHGLRDEVPPGGDGRPVVTLVGDSYVFGSGVPDGNTLADALEARLRDVGVEAACVNLGIPGLAARSFGDMIRYGSRIATPSVHVVLVKDDDLSPVDTNTRMAALSDSWAKRLAVLTRLESAFEVLRITREHATGPSVSGAEIRAWLDDVADAAGEAWVLLVTDVRYGSEEQVIDAWVSEHPNVVWLNVRDDPAWRAAPRIPGDGHWDVAGTRQVAGVLSSDVGALLELEP